MTTKEERIITLEATIRETLRIYKQYPLDTRIETILEGVLLQAEREEDFKEDRSR